MSTLEERQKAREYRKRKKEEAEKERQFWDDRNNDPSLQPIANGARRAPVRYE